MTQGLQTSARGALFPILKVCGQAFSLTGLPNRTLLEDRIATALLLASRDHNQNAIMFIDLDGFKLVNDQYGHLAGDLVLQEVSKRFQKCIRESDTVARLGGDEFVIMSSGLESRDGLEVIAKHVLSSFETPFVYEGNELWLGCSIGIALYPDHGDHPKQLLERADAAMYNVKNIGKGSYAFWQPVP